MLLAALALLAAAPAAAPPREQGQCINEDASTSWAPVDDHTLLVTSGARSFKVTTSVCPALTRAGLPQVHVVLPGGGYICGPHDAHLYVSTAGGVGPIPCFMQAITPLTEAQAKALTRR